MRLQNSVGDVERASCAPRPFGEGFPDISMYVVQGRPSKNAACMQPDNLRRIFRKLRLAVFGRICRLPIGLGSLLARTRNWFPILRCRMSGIASRITAAAAGTAPLSPRQSQPDFGPFWAAGSSQSDNSGRQPASLATHRAGRAYYIYVASQNAKQGFLTGNPKGSFGRPITFQSDPAWPKTGTATEKWGRSRHSG
jgi:hypothetical protein